MPLLTRWMLKTSLLYLLAALLAGVIQALAGLPGPLDDVAFLLYLEPARVHLFVVGWITLLIFGVVFWMFPKYSREKPRGHEGLGWAAYGLLNLGLLLRIAFEPVVQPATVTGWLLVVSALAQWMGGLAFFVLAWTRVKEK